MEDIKIGERALLKIETLRGTVIINTRYLASIQPVPQEQYLDRGEMRTYQPPVALVTMSTGQTYPSEDEDLLELLGFTDEEPKAAPNTPPELPPLPPSTPPSAPAPEKKKKRWMP